MKPIATLWGTVAKEIGLINPEWEYRLCPEARAYLKELNHRIRQSELTIRELQAEEPEPIAKGPTK